MSPPDVMGPGEVRQVLDISRQRLLELAARDDFPTPTVLSIGKVWDAPEIRAYARDRLQGSTRHRRFLLHYRRHGNVAAAARHAGINRTTGHKWLTKLGIREEVQAELEERPHAQAS